MEDGTLPEPAPINRLHEVASAVIGDGTHGAADMAGPIFEGEAEIGS